ncbi:MAG: hypothetical protein NC090_05445 [Anaeroplasma bactoclasticum]|nr:hypothetical protein [Anaeroplasma bactoclasticum]
MKLNIYLNVYESSMTLHYLQLLKWNLVIVFFKNYIATDKVNKTESDELEIHHFF